MNIYTTREKIEFANGRFVYAKTTNGSDSTFVSGPCVCCREIIKILKIVFADRVSFSG